MMKKPVWFLLLLCLPTLSIAKKSEIKHRRKATVFASWGYNRARFTNSSIHFIGNDYNFKLQHAVAKDRQSSFNLNTYFNLSYLTIPQYNFCIGVILPNHFIIRIGQDHMKYVLQQQSQAIIDGYIHNHSKFDGDFDHEPRKITPDFLQFEHTDGLNYVHLSLAKEQIWVPKQFKHIEFSSNLGLNAGLLIPRSDVSLMHYARNDEFHLAGYGLGFNAEIKTTFFQYFFISLHHKIGFINMPYILTRGIEYSDRAKQCFGFTEFYFSIGLHSKI